MSYPASIKQFVTKIDKNASGWYVGPEYFNVPASSPYQLYLDHVPKDSATTVVGASGGLPYTEILTGTPLVNQYLMDYDYGKVTFNVGNAGMPVYATYENLGDDIMAEHVNTLQGEVVNVEEALAAGVAGGYSTLKERLDAADVYASASGIDGQRLVDDTVRAGALRDDIKGALWVTEGSPTLTDIAVHINAVSDAHDATAISAVEPGTSTFNTVQKHINAKVSDFISDINPHGQALSDFPGTLQLDNLDVKDTLKGYNVFGQFISASGNIISIKGDGPDGDQYLAFYQNGDTYGAQIKWNDSAEKFETSHGLDVLGNVSASGNIVPIGINGATPSGVRIIGTQAIPFANGAFDVVESVSYATGGDTGATGKFTAGANTVTVRNGLIVSIV